MQYRNHSFVSHRYETFIHRVVSSRRSLAM